jgi:hypothetical protein
MRIFRFSLEKRLVVARPRGMPICSQISCARTGWEVPENTFRPEVVEAMWPQATTRGAPISETD